MNKVRKVCPACDEFTLMTRHHVYPRRHNCRKNNNCVFLLCRTCHDKLETYIPYQKMPRDFYPAILKIFLAELCLKAKAKEQKDDEQPQLPFPRS